MMNRLINWTLVSAFGVALVASAPVAFADEEGGEGGEAKPAATETAATPAVEAGGTYTKETWPSEVVKRPLTLAKGMLEIDGNTFWASLSTDAVFKPFGLAPSVTYGLADNMQLRLYFLEGLCLAGDTNGCVSVLNDVGVDFSYLALPTGPFNLAVHGGIEIPNFKDKMFMGLRIGALGRYLLSPQMAIVFDPSIYIGLTERDFNKEHLAIPVWFQFQATPVLNVFLTTTFGGPLDGFGDAFFGSLGVGGLYNINKMLDAGLEFDFTNLYGKGGGADGRELFIRVNVRI